MDTYKRYDLLMTDADINSCSMTDKALVDPRFTGVEALYGAEAFAKIASASICIVGVGGVGSWCAEACARSGVGTIAIVDLDDVCVTNVNRQIQALTSTLGASKCQVLGQRLKDINPSCNVRIVEKFATSKSVTEILSHNYDVIIDAIDSTTHKTSLIAACVSQGLPIVTIGSGGNRSEPSSITVSDLSSTEYDPLLQAVRKRLRQKHNFPRGKGRSFRVPCVYAPLQRKSREGALELCDGEHVGRRATCNNGLGSTVITTGTMGFIAVGEALRIITKA